jgi:hypothetical protein
MRKLYALLGLAAVVGVAVVALRKPVEAMPPPPLQPVRIICDGANPCCNGTGITSAGIREFVYNVKVASGGLASVTSVDVGTHIDNNLADYTNLVMPPNWTLTILPVTRPCHGPHCTQHGGTSLVDDSCLFTLHFSGPAKTSNFTLAYDFVPNFDIHDADWRASNGSRARWNLPVGMGDGPIHSPWQP